MDYLRVARKRLGILVGLPVLAALVAVAVVLLSPPTYSVTAYVAAPALIGGVASQQFSGAQGANQFVAAFAAATTSPKVIDQVAADTGVAKDALRDGAVVKQVGASSQLKLTWTGDRKDTPAPVAKAMTARALKFLFESQVGVATQRVTAADKDVAAATAKIAAWETKNKVTQPDKQFQAMLNQQGELQRQELELTADGNTLGARAAADALRAGQTRIDELGPKLPGYQALLAQRDAATGALTDAQKGLQAATAQLGAADPDQVADVGGVSAADRVAELAKIVPPVTGAGVLVAVLLIALLEILARPRDRASAEQPAEREPAKV